MAKKEKKKRKLKIGKLILFLLLITIIGYLFLNMTDFSVKSIIVKGNTIYTDQEIIEMSGLTNHTSKFTIIPRSVEKKLEKNTYSSKAKLSKNFMTLKRTIEENRPI